MPNPIFSHFGIPAITRRIFSLLRRAKGKFYLENLHLADVFKRNIEIDRLTKIALSTKDFIHTN